MVTRTTISKPSKVDRAHDRLSDAIVRLESALPSADSPLMTLGGRTASEQILQMTEMTAEVQNLRDENIKLRGLNKQISKRLDGAIERFKQVIGE